MRCGIHGCEDGEGKKSERKAETKGISGNEERDYNLLMSKEEKQSKQKLELDR